MARVLRDLGAEKLLIKFLRDNRIHQFNTLEEIEQYQRTADTQLRTLREQTINRLKEQLTTQKQSYQTNTADLEQQRTRRVAKLQEEQRQLHQEITVPLLTTRNPFKWISQRIRRRRQRRRLQELDSDFWGEVGKPFHKHVQQLESLSREIHYSETHFDETVDQQMQPHIHRKEHTDRVLQGGYTWLSGAKGEQKTLRTLYTLSDEYIVINDFRLHAPMRINGQYRAHFQADHLVIGPSGVFNIETKNWSNDSVQNRDLRSPIEQVCATGTALWRTIKNAVGSQDIQLRNHHWGERKIPVRNILAMVNAVPKDEFEYVKLLPVTRVPGYIRYFPKNLDTTEVEQIVLWCLENCED